jgi:hypothetical protein
MKLFFLTATVVSYIVLCLRKQHNLKLFWTISYIFIVACRLLSDYESGYCNPDEIEWQFKANSLIDSPAIYIKYFLWSDIWRILTIIPLAIISFITNSNSPLIPHLIQSTLYFFIVLLLSSIFNILYNKTETSQKTGIIFLIFYALQSGIDIVAYNSETPALTLYLTSVYFFILGLRRNKNMMVFFSSIILSITPLAKEQIFIISLITGILYIIIIFKVNKKILGKTIVFLSIFPLLILTAAIITENIDFIQITIANISDYKNNSLYNSQQNIFQKITSNLIISFKMFSTLYYLVLVLIIFIIFLRPRINISKREIFIFLTVIITTIYTTASPGNNFYHYLHFHVLFLFPIFFYSQSILSNQKTYLLNILILTTFAVISIRKNTLFLNENKHIDSSKKTQLIQAKLINQINTLRPKFNPYGLVWGWNTEIYLKTKSKRSTTYSYPVFTQRTFSKSAESLKIYQNDIEYFQPDYILCNVGKNAFFFDNHDDCLNNPMHPLHSYVMKKYVIIDSGDSYELFIHK